MSVRKGTKIEVFSLDKKNKNLEKEVFGTVKVVLDFLKESGVKVEICLAGNQKMRFLNKKFRDKNSPANVLSFGETKDFIEPATPLKRIGEIYLNISCLKGKNGKFEKAVAARLIIHSLLHLLGYTHKNNNDRMKMEKKEKLFLEYAKNYHRFGYRFSSNKRSSRSSK